MRLRLIIERHSLPPVKVVWTVGRVLPPLANAGVSYTISQLLEQINQTIPLQSDQWRLEDYVVETGGFECLHFSQIDDVLDEDDEVRIRPLQRTDLYDRKISGRYQTTADGRLLIDGVTFGRRSASAEARPSVDIPPRKKRRIEQEKYDDIDTVSGGEQNILRSGSDKENCNRKTIDKVYRLAKLSAEDERLGLLALDDGRESSPEIATFSNSTMSVDEDDQTFSTPSSANDSREANSVTCIGLDRRNWVRPIDDVFEPSDRMNIFQLHFGDSDDSGSGDDNYEPNGVSTVVNNIGNLETLAESSHYSENQDSKSAEKHSVSIEDDAHYTISRGGEAFDEEIGKPTNMHDPLIIDVDDDELPAVIELDCTDESIYESEEKIECGSEDMSLSSGDDSDATNQRGVNHHMNIRDLFFADLEADDLSDMDYDPPVESAAESEENMEGSFEGHGASSDEESDAIMELDPDDLSIRDIFYADLEVDHSSDGDRDAGSETTTDSEEDMENSSNSNDADSDYTDDPNAAAMTILHLVRQGDIDDRSSDEEYEPADDGTDDDREGSESDKENSEKEIGKSGSSSIPEPDGSAKHRSNSSPLPTPSSHTSLTLKIDRYSTKTVWGPLAPGHAQQLPEAGAPSSSVTLRGDSIMISSM